MGCYHFHLNQLSRGKGQSAIASAAYRAGTKLECTYYGEVSDYTRKGGVVLAEIHLPKQAPERFKDRETLWNEVEWIEGNKKAQLAHSFDIALMNEFSMEENIELARRFVEEQLVARGMIADLAIHDPKKAKDKIPNPHMHIMGGCINDIRQLGAGNLVLICDRAHDRANRQAVEVVIHKNQRTEQRGRYQSGALTFQVAGGPLTVSAGAAGFLHEHNDHAQKDHEHQNGKIHTIDHCVKQRIKRNPRVEFCHQQCAKGTPRKQ